MATVVKEVNVTQVSTNDPTLVAGSILSASRALVISYTIKNTGSNSINWKVVAGNTADLSDGIDVKASAAVAARPRYF